MTNFSERVKKNFHDIDGFLEKKTTNFNLYWLLFSIRTHYSVIDELNIQKGEVSLSYEFKNLIRIFYLVLIYPITTIAIGAKENISILGQWRFDRELSKAVNIPQLELKREWSFLKLNRIKHLFYFIVYFSQFFREKKFDKRKLLRNFCNALYFWKYYNEADLSGIKLIIVEDDLNSVHVAILLRSMQESIIRVKTEYTHIDSLLHNNVFADYYFYPTTYNKIIRDKSNYNENVKYIKGGYLNAAYLGYPRDINKVEKQNIVTYFTGHSNLFAQDDTFYIAEILTFLPSKFELVIKVHPYDKIEKYEYLKTNPQVRVCHFSDISNLDLILKSKFCISIFSGMSLDAKVLCNNSYFINYTWKDSYFAEDYRSLNLFFDTISSSEMLSDVLSNKFQAKPLDLFNANFNMTYPDTFTVFDTFIKNLIK